jgi:hypothetical protein
MGNIFNKENKDSEIDAIKARLLDLEKYDANNDGVINKEEMEQFIYEQKRDLAKFKKEIQKKEEEKYRVLAGKTEAQLVEARSEIKSLNDQVASLLAVNNALETQLREKTNFEQLIENNNSNEFTNNLKEVSRIRINQIVDEMLKDENLNIKYLPDWVEKQIYRNVFTIMISLMDNLFDTTNLRFLGHELSFDLKPIQLDEHRLDEHSKEFKLTVVHPVEEPEDFNLLDVQKNEGKIKKSHSFTHLMDMLKK